jgi:hypothetical protein
MLASSLRISQRTRATGKRGHRSKRNLNASESDQNRSGTKAEDGNPGAIRGASLEGELRRSLIVRA